jgi:hypothetical protein
MVHQLALRCDVFVLGKEKKTVDLLPDFDARLGGLLFHCTMLNYPYPGAQYSQPDTYMLFRSYQKSFLNRGQDGRRSAITSRIDATKVQQAEEAMEGVAVAWREQPANKPRRHF